ncbi:MAG: hypothetical protein K0Q83_3814, partial [Deltaproteobacteria bacterium]|nr:hypothetical protein [Deltaproteobacteria bacterium]
RNPGRQTQSGGLEKSFLGQFFITVEMGAESLIDVTRLCYIEHDHI